MKLHRRNFLKTLSAGAATLAAPVFVSAQQKAKRPNFVFFLVDDLGYMDIGCNGATFCETPNIDKLAKSAMRFTDAYAACPVCSPTRASIMTGRYPSRVNITDWIPGQRPKNRPLFSNQDLDQLPLEEVTIAEALKKENYKTFFCGKWHLGSTGFFPEDQGFDINKGGHHKGSPPGGYYSPYKNPKLTSGPDGEYLTDRLADESIKFMNEQTKANPDQPFLLYFSFYNVHTPIQACKKHIEKFKKKKEELPELKRPDHVQEGDGWNKERNDNAAYASMVYAMDENVGRVLEALDKLNLTDNTVVIFMSDNGGLSTLYRKNAPTSNYPLRSGKGWCYEGGIREPMIIRAPEVTKPGSTCEVPVTSTDFFPTMLELAGMPLQPKLHVDGKSLVPLLKGGKSLDRKAIFWHYPHYHGSAWKPGAAVRAGDWKMIEFYESGRAELYNLKDDLSERKELSKSHPEKKAELQKMLRDWQKEIGAVMPTQNPNYKEGDSAAKPKKKKKKN